VSIGGFSISRFAANAPEIVARALTDVLAELAAGRLAVDVAIVDMLDGTAGA
jgi:hypothetical protein